jgi:hypothetical protein
MTMPVRFFKNILFVLVSFFVFTCASVITCAEDAGILPVGLFSENTIDQWQPKKFVSETQYSLVLVDEDMVLKAVSLDSASGLIKKIRVDLEQYPFLNWKWRIETLLQGVFNEKEKSGDDYAARIYVVVSGGIAVWNTKALNYVWARNASKGATWPNAFAENNAVMMALRSSESPASVWHTEKRNVREDFKKLFGKDVRFIDAVVLMTDTDNTQQEAVAYYGDIFFSGQ